MLKRGTHSLQTTLHKTPSQLIYKDCCSGESGLWCRLRFSGQRTLKEKGNFRSSHPQGWTSWTHFFCSLLPKELTIWPGTVLQTVAVLFKSSPPGLISQTGCAEILPHPVQGWLCSTVCVHCSGGVQPGRFLVFSGFITRGSIGSCSTCLGWIPSWHLFTKHKPASRSVQF